MQKTIEEMASELGIPDSCPCDAPACLGGECFHECERLDRTEQYIRDRYAEMMPIRNVDDGLGQVLADALCPDCGQSTAHHDHRPDNSGLDDGPIIKEPRKKPTPKTPEELREIRAKAWKTRRRVLVEKGCPVCFGDCSAANPPMAYCPMRDDVH